MAYSWCSGCVCVIPVSHSQCSGCVCVHTAGARGVSVHTAGAWGWCVWNARMREWTRPCRAFLGFAGKLVKMWGVWPGAGRRGQPTKGFNGCRSLCPLPAKSAVSLPRGLALERSHASLQGKGGDCQSCWPCCAGEGALPRSGHSRGARPSGARR